MSRILSNGMHMDEPIKKSTKHVRRLKKYCKCRNSRGFGHGIGLQSNPDNMQMQLSRKYSRTNHHPSARVYFHFVSLVPRINFIVVNIKFKSWKTILQHLKIHKICIQNCRAERPTLWLNSLPRPTSLMPFLCVCLGVGKTF